MGRTVGKAHAEALVLTEAEAARIKSCLMAVLRFEQDGVERALRVYGSEELCVTNLRDDIFCSWEGPTVFAGLGVNATHVNA